MEVKEPVLVAPAGQVYRVALPPYYIYLSRYLSTMSVFAVLIALQAPTKKVHFKNLTLN